MAIKTGILFLIIFIASFPCASQFRSPVTWTHGVDKLGDTHVLLTLTALIPEGWHLYSQYNTSNGRVPTRIDFFPNKNVRLVGDVVETGNCSVTYNEIYEADIRSCVNSIEFLQQAELLARPCEIDVSIEYMACSEDLCIPGRTILTIHIY